MGRSLAARLWSKPWPVRTLLVGGLVGSLTEGAPPDSWEGWLLRAGAAGVALLGNVAGNVLAEEVRQLGGAQSEWRSPTSIATGRAIAGAVREAASAKHADAFAAIATRVEMRHARGDDKLDVDEAPAPNEVDAFFADPSGFCADHAIAAERWREYLRDVALECELDPGLFWDELSATAKRLESEFVAALYRELATDFAQDGAAFADVSLRLLERTLQQLAKLESGQARLAAGTLELRVAITDVCRGLETLREERADLEARIDAALEVAPLALVRLDALLAGQRELLAGQTELGGKLDEGFTRVLARLDAKASETPPVATPHSPHMRPPPALAAPLIGRQDELEEIAARLESKRVVTLTGPGGCGKTVVAQAAAHALAKNYEHGCCWVEFATLRDETLVAQEVAEQFKLGEQVRRPPTEVLAEFLADKEFLLVLDNCEHLHEVCVELVKDLIGASSRLRILATSRRPFELVGESVVRVETLQTSEAFDAPADELARVESIALFVERAKDCDPRFVFDRSNASDIARICRTLEGVPLAIELAAARTVYDEPIAEMAADLSRIVERLVREGGRDEHHPSLHAAIARSYHLLDAAEQRAFRRLAVFDGGWTPEAARAVVGEACDKSVANLARHNLAKHDARTFRRSFLEPIRQYAESLLAAEELEDARQRHVEWCTAFAADAERALLTCEREATIDRLEIEHDNLRGAVRWSVQTGGYEWALRLGAALWRFWEIRGYLTEGGAAMRAILELPQRSTERELSRLRAAALSGAATIAYRQGLVAESLEFSTQALAASLAIEDARGAAIAHNDLGIAKQAGGDFEACREHYRACLELHLSSAAPDARELAVANFNTGATELALGRFDAARPLLELARDQFDAIGDSSDIAYPLTTLGLLEMHTGAFEAARAHLERAYTTRHKAGEKRGMGETVGARARVALAEGNLAAARADLRESWRQRREVSDRRGIAACLDTCAQFAAAVGAASVAAQVLGASDAYRKSTGIVRSPIDERTALLWSDAARETLGAQAFESARASGRTWSAEFAVERALAAS